MDEHLIVGGNGCLIGDICNEKDVEKAMEDMEYVHFYAVYIPLNGKVRIRSENLAMGYTEKYLKVEII